MSKIVKIKPIATPRVCAINVTISAKKIMALIKECVCDQTRCSDCPLDDMDDCSSHLFMPYIQSGDITLSMEVPDGLCLGE